MVNNAPRPKASVTLRILAATSSPWSDTMTSSTSFGRVLLISSSLALMSSVTEIVEASRALVISIPSAFLPLKNERRRCSAPPSTISATWPSRIAWSPFCLTTICSNSVTSFRRPCRRILCSSKPFTTLPTGAARFCDRKAATTSCAETFASRIA